MISKKQQNIDRDVVERLASAFFEQSRELIEPVCGDRGLGQLVAQALGQIVRAKLELDGIEKDFAGTTFRKDYLT